MTKIKTNKSILHSNAVRGCWSCPTLRGQNYRDVERTRIKIARAEVLAQSSKTK